VVVKKTTAAAKKKAAVASKKAAAAKRKADADKKKATMERRKQTAANAATAKQKMRDRIAATSTALAQANAEVAAARKRHDLLIKMAEKKEAAVAKFVESWTKAEMAKIEKALKPKSRSKSSKAK
jgi:colicin import membrane protein